MIVYPEEDITTTAQPVRIRCPEPCRETWFDYFHMLEHCQEGHPDLYFDLLGEEDNE